MATAENTELAKTPAAVTISLIVAVDEGNVIGNDNKLPWHLPADLKYFKAQTWGLPVVMGRKTFESIGKPLPGRTSIVITRNTTWAFEKVLVVHTVSEAVAAAQNLGVKEIFIIGGAEVFETALPLAGRVYRTRIHHRFEGDVFFPELQAEDWHLTKSHTHAADEKNSYACTFEVWERKK
ncbi:MAG TPA: dihydrofolate reductase [Chitinophagaceae bacterium]|nr:dihydrofolate reductase [Chitinophagaceae bacterium]